MLKVLLILVGVVSVSSMAGTNAARLRRPVVNRHMAPGYLPQPHVAPTLDEALSTVKQYKTQKLLQSCIDGNMYGIDECMLSLIDDDEVALVSSDVGAWGF